MATQTVYPGSKVPVTITVGGLHNDIKLSDTGVDFTAEFYINGKYSSGKQEVKKTAATKVTDNSYKLYVDTDTIAAFGLGKISCKFTVSKSSDANSKWVFNSSTGLILETIK